MTALNDLTEEGNVNVYDDFNDMIKIINQQLLTNNEINSFVLENFLMENTWEKYAERDHILWKEYK